MSEIFYNKKIKCHYCEENFETFRIRINKSKLIKRDADYCPYYEDNSLNPILYDVNVCPNCGFAFTDSFSRIISSTLYNNVKENYISRIEAVPMLCNERDVESAIYAYKLALYCATLKDEKKIITANLTLRIAWLYRYIGNKTEEERFVRSVLDIYLDIYETEDLDSLSMDKYQFIYLIGELYGRLGDYQKVTRWFSLIIEDKNVSPQVLRITKDRWLEFKELREMD